MHIKNNRQLKDLAELLGIKPEDVSKKVIQYLTDVKLISEDCNNGDLVLDVVSGSGSFPAIVFCVFGKVTNEIQANFLELVIMGDGDCPYCGGETEIHDSAKKVIGGNGYTTPYEYDYEYRYDKCIICDQIITVVPENDND